MSSSPGRRTLRRPVRPARFVSSVSRKITIRSLRKSRVEMHMKNAASLLIFVCVTCGLVVAGDVKTKLISDETYPDGFTLDIPDHHYLRIYNFTQEGTASPRGVVIASAATATPTPAS